MKEFRHLHQICNNKFHGIKGVLQFDKFKDDILEGALSFDDKTNTLYFCHNNNKYKSWEQAPNQLWYKKSFPLNNNFYNLKLEI